METILTSPTKEVRIGPGLPFVIIGERINPTGRKMLAAEMAAGNLERVKNDALAQVAAGAQVLDVNAGIPMVDEPALLAEAIKLVQSVTDVPLCIDSSVMEALEAGLAACKGKPLVNSVTGEKERMDKILPLVAQRGAAVIGLANDETGISEDPDVRFAVAKRIVLAAESYGIKREDVIIDPLTMPVSAVRYSGQSIFKLVRRVREELGCNSSVGASNISFGLPGRVRLNSAFIAMAIAAGVTVAITNPLEEEVRSTIMAADVMMGNDENCAAWLKAERAKAKAAAAAAAGGAEPSAADERAARRASRRGAA